MEKMYESILKLILKYGWRWEVKIRKVEFTVLVITWILPSLMWMI